MEILSAEPPRILKASEDDREDPIAVEFANEYRDE